MKNMEKINIEIFANKKNKQKEIILKITIKIIKIILKIKTSF